MLKTLRSCVLCWIFTVGACSDDPVQPRVEETPNSAEELVEDLEAAYRSRSTAALATLLATEEEYLFILPEPTDLGEEAWGLEDELLLHRRMFDPTHPEAGLPALDPSLRLSGVEISLTQVTAFEERTELLLSQSNADGLDPERWSIRAAIYSFYVFFDTVSDTDYLVEGESEFVVLEDAAKGIGEQGRFLLLRWRELAPFVTEPGARSGGQEPSDNAGQRKTWSRVKSLYRGDRAFRPALSPEGLITRLEAAYAARDLLAYERLFDPALGFDFFLEEPTDQGQASWGLEEELRIHQRMFAPEQTPAGQPPVDPGLWLDGLDIHLTRTSDFAERIDLYQNPENPSGLDPVTWRAMEAEYSSFVYFDTVSETDFSIDGGARFVVVEDREKLVGQKGKFVLLRWEDLCEPPASVQILDARPPARPKRPAVEEKRCLGGIKSLYSQ